MTMIAGGRWVLATLTIVLLVALSGCGTAESRARPTAASETLRPQPSDLAPHFSGPWASEFSDAYRKATSSADRMILSDGVITADEYKRVGAVFVDCMAQRGFKAKLLDGQSGGFEIVGNKDLDKQQVALKACGQPFNLVANLHGEVVRNPQHLDENKIVVECLRRHQLVPNSYSVSKYAAELKSNAFSFDLRSKEVRSCLNNPLEISSLAEGH